MAGPSRDAKKATCWAIEKWTFCHFGYQVGAIFTPYLGIRSEGSSVQTFDWTRNIERLVLQLYTWMLASDRIWSMVLPVYGPPSSIQKLTMPLVHWLLVLITKAVAWLRCYHALQERVPKSWALSYQPLSLVWFKVVLEGIPKVSRWLSLRCPDGCS